MGHICTSNFGVLSIPLSSQLLEDFGSKMPNQDLHPLLSCTSKNPGWSRQLPSTSSYLPGADRLLRSKANPEWALLRTTAMPGSALK